MISLLRTTARVNRLGEDVLGCSISLANRILVDFLNCPSEIEDVERDEGESRPRLVTDGSTGVVGTMVESVPLLEMDKWGNDRYEKTIANRLRASFPPMLHSLSYFARDWWVLRANDGASESVRSIGSRESMSRLDHRHDC